MLALRLVLVPLSLLALGSRTDELAWRVPEGTTLVRTWENSLEVELESIELTMGGEDLSEEAAGMGMRVRVDGKQVVTDVIEALGDGRPERVLRTFDELAGKEVVTYSFDGESQDEESAYESELEGESVRFQYDSDDEEFVAAYAEEGAGDEELLALLVEDMDLRAFLPAGPVSEGDSWEIDGRAFQHVLDPGGDVSLDRVDEEDDQEELDAAMRENLAGKITATYSGTVEEDGRSLARIELAVETRTEGSEAMDEEQLNDGASGTRTVELQWVLTGELLWDVEHGHVASLELAGEHVAVLRDRGEFEMEGESVEQEQVMNLRGKVSYSLVCERR